ncbi:MAG: hypothetical protein LBR53_01410 [Deltaproteobacteria bacterium]|jgi:hypothetical protein|nr:hypothetical protein [Deltaproteobacteria bacterium]
MEFFRRLFSGVPRGCLIALALTVFSALLAWSLFQLLSAGRDDETAMPLNLAAKDIDAVVGGPGDPEYNRLLDLDNVIRADAARKKGDSFVAVPILEKTGGKNQAEAKDPARKDQKSPFRVAASVPQPVFPKGGAPENEPRKPRESPKGGERGLPAKNAGNELKKIMERKNGSARVSYPPERKDEGSAKISTPPPAPQEELGFSPGEILYAVNDLSLNSDLPSPVLCTVAQGRLKGAKALGSFKLSGEHLLLSFSKIVLPDGREREFQGYGVDPRTDGSSVRAKVDTHFFSRWGALLAASFIEGFGEAVSAGGRKVHVYGDGVVEEEVLENSLEDSAFQALGKAGSRAAAQVERGFDRPPTVRLERGEPVGILIISGGNG